MNLYRDGHEEKRKQTKLLFEIAQILKKEESPLKKEDNAGDED